MKSISLNFKKYKNYITNSQASLDSNVKIQELSINSYYLNCIPSLICRDIKQNEITLCINNEGNVYSIGKSDFTAHGHKNYEIFPFKQIQGLTNIKMIDCGYDHTICLNHNGEVYSFGCNYYGNLGIGKDKNELEFTHIPQKINLPRTKQVSCGGNYTICLTDDNRLYSFGLGYYNSPQLITDLDNIEFIECGGGHNICKTFDNGVYSWGSNNYAQLGKGNHGHSSYSVYKCPENIISIKCGETHSLLLTSEGQVYSFGDNNCGQLAFENWKSVNSPILISDIPKIQRIECGMNHSMCIDIDNNLWLFGGNYHGQLGLGDDIDRFKPVLHPTLLNIIDISSGGTHTFVKTIDNKIYAFGNNNHSQLGIETSKEYQLTPIQVFIDNEDIWCSTIGKSRQKSARK